jgi:hypothetical protein
MKKDKKALSNLSSMVLHITSDDQLFYFNFLLFFFIWFSIIHHYLTQINWGGFLCRRVKDELQVGRCRTLEWQR